MASSILLVDDDLAVLRVVERFLERDTAITHLDREDPMALVLLVDDAQELREFYRALLEAAGHDVIEAEDGRDAIPLVEQHHPSVVVMDLDMPIMDGVEATRRIKATDHGRGTPVLLLTSRERPPESEADAYLRKPCPPAELLNAITLLLAAAAP